MAKTHMRFLALASAALVTALAAPLAAKTDEAPPAILAEEFEEVFKPVVNHISKWYVEKIPSDSLMHAAVKGLFYALDPEAEYTFPESDSRPRSLRTNLAVFNDILNTVNDSTYYSVGADTLVRFAIAGMLNVLDPYTAFMEKRNLDNFRINTRGKYGGLGFKIQVMYPDSAIAVWSLLHDQTPSARAGVHSGDIIIAIDDSSTKGMSAGDAADLMRGDAGTPVTLTLERAGVEDPLDITIFREVVQIESVPYYTLFPDGTAYLKLEGFQQHCSQDVRQALLQLRRQGMKRLIFDLRGNGGGYLQEAVRIADLFLPKNRLVVYTAGRAFSDTSKYATREDALLEDEPLIVLVDNGSASASEIVSGAIQDWDRGLILGMPTVGKGSVQQTIPIGDKAELKLTMAAYFIPSGRSIHKHMRKDSTLVATDKTFKTRVLGRQVKGGGGVTPDVYMESRTTTPLYRQLRGYRSANSMFFRFARQYHTINSKLTPQFRATERTLDQFEGFLSIKDFDYESDLERILDVFAEDAAEDAGEDKLKKSIKRLDDDIQKAEKHHWEENAELLTWQLTFDILEKNFGIRQAYAYNAEDDPQIVKARQIIADPVAYNEYFQKTVVGEKPEDPMAQAADAHTDEKQ
jgi:carboxyl-terminal processing protease